LIFDHYLLGSSSFFDKINNICSHPIQNGISNLFFDISTQHLVEEDFLGGMKFTSFDNKMKIYCVKSIFIFFNKDVCAPCKINFYFNP